MTSKLKTIRTINSTAGVARTSTPRRKSKNDLSLPSRYGRKQWNDDRSGYVWTKSDLNFGRHFMHKAGGWAFDLETRSRLLEDSEFLSLRIETDDGTVYEASREALETGVGAEFRCGRFPTQVALPLSYWQVTRPEKVSVSQ